MTQPLLQLSYYLEPKYSNVSLGIIAMTLMTASIRMTSSND